MIAWLKARCSSACAWVSSFFRPERGEKKDTYSPRQRAIYRYFVGTDERGAEKFVVTDPMALYRKVMDRRDDITVNVKVALSPSKDADECYARMIAHIREIFGVAPYEQGGLTEIELMELYDHFLTYAEGVKKNSSPTPTSSRATSPGTPLSWAAARPTGNTSASGSTVGGSSSAPPAPSPTGQPSPTAT